jgi:hypothetical protein
VKAIVTKEFRGRRDDKTTLEDFKPGDEIEGDLAEIAVRDKLAEDADEKATKAKAAALKKAKERLATVTDAVAKAQAAFDGAADKDKEAAEATLVEAKAAVTAATQAVSELS